MGEGNKRMGEGWSRTGKGIWGEVGRQAAWIPAGTQAWNLSSRILLPSATEGCALGRLAPAQPGGLALAGALIRSSFPIVDSEDISNLFWTCLCVSCFPSPSEPQLATRLKARTSSTVWYLYFLAFHSFLKPLHSIFCLWHLWKLLKPRSLETSMWPNLMDAFPVSPCRFLVLVVCVDSPWNIFQVSLLQPCLLLLSLICCLLPLSLVADEALGSFLDCLLSFCTFFSYFIHSQVSKFQLSEMDTFQSATQAGILGNILD